MERQAGVRQPVTTGANAGDGTLIDCHHMTYNAARVDADLTAKVGSSQDRPQQRIQDPEKAPTAQAATCSRVSPLSGWWLVAGGC